MQATYEDVQLILRLYELRREPRLREAREWFSRNFYASSLEELWQVAPMGSTELTNVRMVVSYWDMVASFITAGVLNQDLFFQSGGELLMVWVRYKDVLPGQREQFGNPKLFHNLEIVAKHYIDYMGRPAYEAFAARMGQRPK